MRGKLPPMEKKFYYCLVLRGFMSVIFGFEMMIAYKGLFENKNKGLAYE